MEQDYKEYNLLIERYLRDELSEDEATAFEETFLGSGELLDQLEAAEKLGEGLRDIAALEKSRVRTRAPGRIPALFRSPQYAMAASFLLVVSLGVTGVLYQRLNDLDGSINITTPSPTEIVPLISVRGSSGDVPANTLTAGAPSATYVLMLDPGFEPYSHFRATIQTPPGASPQRTILQADHLEPGYEDMLAVSVPAALLEPGDYAIRVEGWRDDAQPGQEFALINVVSLRVLPSD